MDRLSNLTSDVNSTAIGSVQKCVPDLSSTLLDKLLVTSPSWSVLNQDLRWMFILHTYGFACLFFVLSFYTFFSFLNLRSLIANRPFMSTINVFLCILGASRSLSFFIDPYNLQEIMPKVIGSIMWDIGFPCITSAFCLVQLAFLQLTQFKFGLEKILKETCLNIMIIFNFALIIVSDVALVFHNHYIAKYVVQTVFLVWGIILYMTFLHAGYKVKILLRKMPPSLLTRDNSSAHQKGIMQFAMLAPYNNLATSVVAAFAPTLLGQTLTNSEECNTNKEVQSLTGSMKPIKIQEERKRIAGSVKERPPPLNLTQEPVSTVPEVYVRPPTPTPSLANLPSIVVSKPSRSNSIVSSRRSSDASGASRRSSECSVRFINEEDFSPTSESKRISESSERSRTPDGILRRHSECTTPTGSNKDLRRSSDSAHRSQFSTLRRNSDFGNRIPKRNVASEDQSKLCRILDVSPQGSRRNSDLGGLTSMKSTESRRNSDASCGRRPDLPLISNRRSSDVNIRVLDKSPNHFHQNSDKKTETREKSESDVDQPDCGEKAALMMKNSLKDKVEGRKKSLSWKNGDKITSDHESITAETSLLPDIQPSDNRGTDFTLHSILNHIAYVNRAKAGTPLHIPEANSTAAERRSQIQRVLNVTYATAVLGIVLCVADVIRIFGSYGLFAEVVKYGTKPSAAQFPKPWPWLLYQTLCRSLELIMGCTMASITKQPSASPRRLQYLNNYSNYTLRVKQRDNNYI